MVFDGQEALESFLMEEDDICIQNAAWNKLYRRELMGELRFPTGKYYEDIVYTTMLLARSQRTVYLDLALYNYCLLYTSQAQRLDGAGAFVHGVLGLPGLKGAKLEERLPVKVRAVSENRDPELKTQMCPPAYLKTAMAFVPESGLDCRYCLLYTSRCV